MAEVGEITIDKARELLADAALWPRVRDFLWDFAPQIHKSWLEEIPGLSGIYGTSGGSGASASPRIKRYILSSLEVEPFFHDFPKGDWSRIALLDGAVLLEIAKWLGALACVDALRMATDGKTVRSLKTALPGVYPEVFGYTMYFPCVADIFPAETQSSRSIVEKGCLMLFSALDGLAEPLKRRTELKLPNDLCGLRLSAPLRETKARFALSAIPMLLKLKFPEAYSICCS